MLTEIFGLEWYKVHDEAEQLEHAVSADFERKLIEKLGTARECPHGNQVGMDSPGAAPRARTASRWKKRSQATAWWWSASSSAIASCWSTWTARESVRECSVEVVSGGRRDRAACTAGRTVRLERAAAAKVWVGQHDRRGC